MKKICVQLSIRLNSDYVRLTKLPFTEIQDIVIELNQMAKSKK